MVNQEGTLSKIISLALNLMEEGVIFNINTYNDDRLAKLFNAASVSISNNKRGKKFDKLAIISEFTCNSKTSNNDVLALHLAEFRIYTNFNSRGIAYSAGFLLILRSPGNSISFDNIQYLVRKTLSVKKPSIFPSDRYYESPTDPYGNKVLEADFRVRSGAVRLQLEMYSDGTLNSINSVIEA